HAHVLLPAHHRLPVTDTPSLRLLSFCKATATTDTYTLSLHDALPICANPGRRAGDTYTGGRDRSTQRPPARPHPRAAARGPGAAAPLRRRTAGQLRPGPDLSLPRGGEAADHRLRRAAGQAPRRSPLPPAPHP